MDELKAWKLTPAQIWLLSVLGFAILAVGAALDGASILAILIIPLVLALWAGAVLAIDRWVRDGIDQPGWYAGSPRPSRRVR
jgi:hypothetical protein